MSRKGKKYTNRMTKAMKKSKDINTLKKVIAVEKARNDEKQSFKKKVWNDYVRFQDELNDLKSTVIHKTTKYCKEIIDTLESQWPKVGAEQIVIIRKAQEGVIRYFNEVCSNGISMMKEMVQKAQNDVADDHKVLKDMKAVYEETRSSMAYCIEGTKSNGANSYYLAKLKANIRSQMREYTDTIDIINEFNNKK
ncbi:MAG: hypothetical protein HDQ88_10215 [Clostridia bacterium]|nr:hypothetical protein [Clostridia bacterium]